MPDNLLLGSGDWRWGMDWLHVDANPTNNPDIVAVLPPLPECVKALRFNRIVASHFIEHLYPQDAKALLKECYQCLRNGGILVLEQPDIEYCARVMLGEIQPPEGRERDQFSLWGIFGAPNGNTWDSHHWGYTPQTLRSVLIECGFRDENITQEAAHYHEPVRDFILKAMKEL